MAIFMLRHRDIPFYTRYPVPFVCIFFMRIIPASRFCLIKLRALCLWIILISLATHREDSNKPKEQSHLMIAQLSTMDFCQMETLKTKSDVSLYVLKRMKLYECKISFRLSTSFLHVKSGLLLPEEWTRTVFLGCRDITCPSFSLCGLPMGAPPHPSHTLLSAPPSPMTDTAPPST